MTSKKVMHTLGRKKYLAAAIPLIIAAQASAVEFNFGDVEMSLDTQLTIGSSWRMQKQDADLILGIVGSETNAANNNDGDLNFENGDAFSQVFKGTHDFQVSYENFGAFVRGKYWYDTLLEDGTAADGSAFNDDNASEYAKFSGAQILDAFVYGEFELGEMPLDLRIGKQVLSWGESTFIQGGINQTNPFDVAALRRPGAELKEGLIPVNMAFASLGVTENLSAEAFYQIGHQETVISHCGTFFATNDYAPEGCGPVTTAVGNIGRNLEFKDGVNHPSGDGQFGLAFRYFSESLDTEFGLFAMNVHSRVPLVSGTKATIDEASIFLAAVLDPTNAAGSPFNATYNGTLAAGTGPSAAAGFNAATGASYDWTGLQALAATDTTGITDPTTLAGIAGAVSAVSKAKIGAMAATTVQAGALGGTNPYYFVEYPEDQQIAGLSFATNVAGVAVSGELTHKLDVPFQINAVQLLTAVLQADAIKGAGVAKVIADTYASSGGTVSLTEAQVLADPTAVAGIKASVLENTSAFGVEAAFLAEGESLSGYKTFDVTQAQVTAIKLFDQVLGANRYALVAEAGYTYVHEFDENSTTKFDGNGDLEDTVTEGSWGYRLRVSGDYSDVFAGVNLSPVLSFSHDVEGVAPAPGGNFVEDQQVIGLALNAEYANMYTAGISYTMYEGGLTNNLVDRDYAAVTLGVQF